MLVAGCSHAAGSEIDGTEDSEYNRVHSFGSRLAIKLGYHPINIALAGSANSGIARSVLKWFEANYDSTSMEVAVVVAWTESCRMEVPADPYVDYSRGCKNVNWCDASAKDFYRINFGWNGKGSREEGIIKDMHRYMADYPALQEIRTATNVLMLQYFFGMHNIKYIMCSAMQTFTMPDKHLAYYLSMIDKTKYMNLEHQGEAFYWKYRKIGRAHV